ncbi:MAG: methylamine utilization protein [Thiobacillus sp.]|nr:methylamine utilization protein [Thiobacillus sp.]
MKKSFPLSHFLAASFLIATSGLNAAHSANLTLQVKSSSNTPLEDIVVYLVSNKTANLPVRAANAQIQQINKMFVPLVSVVQSGSLVEFPNRDTFRHHVYSFSPAKKFEIKLYADTPTKPVLFDKAGYVVMGCNIHDNMISHLLIVDTPYFGKTDANGIARILDVPAGDYSLTAWNYRLPNKDSHTAQITVKTDSTQTLLIKTRPDE